MVTPLPSVRDRGPSLKRDRAAGETGRMTPTTAVGGRTTMEDLERVYANAMVVHGGPYDVALDFGQRIGDERPEYHVRSA